MGGVEIAFSEEPKFAMYSNETELILSNLSIKHCS